MIIITINSLIDNAHNKDNYNSESKPMSYQQNRYLNTTAASSAKA